MVAYVVGAKYALLLIFEFCVNELFAASKFEWAGIAAVSGRKRESRAVSELVVGS